MLLKPKWLGGSSCNGERLSALAQWHTVKDVLEKAETETGVGYGEAIVRLRIAVRSLESSLQAANGQGLGAEFVRPIRSLLATCKKDLTTVEKDNSTGVSCFQLNAYSPPHTVISTTYCMIVRLLCSNGLFDNELSAAVL